MRYETCPRCESSLVPAYGLLGEDVCSSCGGRVLSPALTKKVLLDEGGLDPHVVMELAREFAGKRLPCPGCGQLMSPVTLKGTALDICFPCGATFLDQGELERFSQGRHVEHSPPPALVRPVDEKRALAPLGEREEAPPDPRRVWEKAVPLYVVEAWGVWALVLSKGWAPSPLSGVGIALGVVSIPLGLSALVDMDRTSLLPARRWQGLGFGLAARHRDVVGRVGLFAGVFLGGLVSSVNAKIAERFPKVFNMKNALVALGGLIAAGAALTFF